MTDQGLVAVDLVVTGRVQGVFFRASMREVASELGVTGWARNEDDGSVRAHLEGPSEAVAQLVAWCREGPRQARVSDVSATESAPTGATAFEVG